MFRKCENITPYRITLSKIRAITFGNDIQLQPPTWSDFFLFSCVFSIILPREAKNKEMSFLSPTNASVIRSGKLTTPLFKNVQWV